MDFTNQNQASAGNSGKGVRSDCRITIELTSSGGLVLQLNSKVESMFGDDIRQQIDAMARYFGISNALIQVDDTGALPFVLAARMEAAARILNPDQPPYLLPLVPANNYSTARDRNRISRLYLPGNSPSLMINAGIHKPDGIILDLEDAVAPDKKQEARFLVRNALRNLDFYGAERMVRINQIPSGLDDLEYVVPHQVNLILVPKCEHPSQLEQVNQRIGELKKAYQVDYPIWLMPIIESALGVMNAFTIAQCEKVVAMAIGLEDYTADLGVQRTRDGNESFFARSMVVNACKAAGIQAIDSVFSDVADMEGLRENVLRSKSLGFDGMGCIHPRQIKVIHDHYAPVGSEIEKAARIVKAFEEAASKGLGVVSLGTKMIDAPVVKRAQKVIELAISLGKLSPEWNQAVANDPAP